MDLICIFLMANDTEQLLMCLLTICTSSLEKYLFKSFVHLKNGLLVFLLLYFKSFQNIFWTFKYMIHNYFQIWAVFMFLIVFLMHKILKFWWNLTYLFFSSVACVLVILFYLIWERQNKCGKILKNGFIQVRSMWNFSHLFLGLPYRLEISSK